VLRGGVFDEKPGVVTGVGKLSDDLSPGTLKSIWKQAVPRVTTKRYLIVIEPTDSGFSAYSPDLPGYVAG